MTLTRRACDSDQRWPESLFRLRLRSCSKIL